MNPITVRRYPRAPYSESCYVPPAPAAPQNRSLTSRVEQIHGVVNLLDHLPVTQVPEQTFDFPPLPGKAAQESFTGPLKPIPAFKLP